MTNPATIFVRFTSPALHCWPGAHERRAYLRAEHRHLFHIEVSTLVTHDDRDIEFHDLRDNALSAFQSLGKEPGKLGPMSCEMMAREMCRLLHDDYPKRTALWTVTVSEDGEMGAVVSE